MKSNGKKKPPGAGKPASDAIPKRVRDRKVHGGGTAPASAPMHIGVAGGGGEVIKLSEIQQERLGTAPGGLRCPNCGCSDLRSPAGPGWETVKTIQVAGSVRRYRICRNCGQRVRTRESVDKVL